MHLRTLAFLLAVSTLLPWTAASATDFNWQAFLRSEMVRSVGGNWVYDEFQVCTPRFNHPTLVTTQTRWSAEASQAAVSRDRFVALTAQMNTTFLLGLFAEVGVTAENLEQYVQCRQRPERVGDVDLHVHVVMSAEGMHVQVRNRYGVLTTQVTALWRDVYQ